jgi:protein-S-isoprenylcysteine O-methyltransferase Ste14
LAALLVAWLLNNRWPIMVGSPPGTWIAGGIILLVGVGILIAGVRAFARAKTPISVREPTAALVTSGPYRYSRNPLYIGLAIAYFGLGTAFNATVWTLVLLPFLLIAVQKIVVAREERYLEERFGQAYRDYKARVRRWL